MEGDAADILSTMPVAFQESVRRMLADDGDGLRRRLKFVSEYAATLDGKLAAGAAGEDPGFAARVLKEQQVAAAADALIKRHAEACELKAEYVRSYIANVLEFCPLDFFTPSEDGGWMIDPDTYSKLPHEVRRLVENVEVRTFRGQSVLSVSFVSKTAALALAARYTLTRHVGRNTDLGIPWDKVVARAERDARDSVETRLARMESGGAA